MIPTFLRNRHLGVWLFISLLVLTTGVLIRIFAPLDPADYLYSQPQTQEENSGFYEIERQRLVEGQPMPWMSSGDDSPVVTVVEFTDFTCPHCLNNWPAVRQILTRYPRRIKLVLRHRTPSVNSLNLALASNCAGEQGKFWEMHDKLFQNQSATLGGDEAGILGLANQINLNQDTFKVCLRNRKFLDAIKQDMQDSQKLNVAGTPTWFINGVRIEGELSLERLAEIIDPLLE